jgi:hypothetical protein
MGRIYWQKGIINKRGRIETIEKVNSCHSNYINKIGGFEKFAEWGLF